MYHDCILCITLCSYTYIVIYIHIHMSIRSSLNKCGIGIICILSTSIVMYMIEFLELHDSYVEKY